MASRNDEIIFWCIEIFFKNNSRRELGGRKRFVITEQFCIEFAFQF